MSGADRVPWWLKNRTGFEITPPPEARSIPLLSPEAWLDRLRPSGPGRITGPKPVPMPEPPFLASKGGALSRDRTHGISTSRLSEMLRQDYAPEPAVPRYPPVLGFGYRIPIIPPREKPVPLLTEMPGGPPSTEAEKAASLGRVLRAALAEREGPIQNSAMTKEAKPNMSGQGRPQQEAEKSDVTQTALGDRKNSAQYSRPAIFDAGPPTDQPVDEYAMYRLLGFDPDGPSKYLAGLKYLPYAGTYFGTAKEATLAFNRHFGEKVEPHNNAADAFRHALWSYKMTKAKGPQFAKDIADSIEISVPSEPGDRLMDLYNNNVGRQLAMDPVNRGRNDEEVILEALDQGKLQTRYFNVLPVHGRLPTPQLPSAYGILGGQ